jgi:hypothetical protein
LLGWISNIGIYGTLVPDRQSLSCIEAAENGLNGLAPEFEVKFIF